MAGDSWITTTANTSRETVLLVGADRLVRAGIAEVSLAPTRAISVDLNPRAEAVAESLVSLPRAKAVVALISRNATDRAPSLVTIKAINPLKRTNADRSETLAMIGAQGIVLLMAAIRAAIVEATATVVLISELLMGAIVLSAVTREETARLGIAINLHEAKKALIQISVRLTVLLVSIVVAWVAPKAWVIELVKARRSGLSLKRRLRVC